MKRPKPTAGTTPMLHDKASRGVALVLLCGSVCGHGQSSSQTKIASPSGLHDARQAAVLTFYRPNQDKADMLASGCTVGTPRMRMYLDGRYVVTLKPGQYARIYLTPGSHIVDAGSHSQNMLPLIAQAGQHYYAQSTDFCKDAGDFRNDSQRIHVTQTSCGAATVRMEQIRPVSEKYIAVGHAGLAPEFNPAEDCKITSSSANPAAPAK